eukprot:COSAG04_NODE_1602_length_6190_cov_2.412576_4_plen_90_part_00
MSFKSCGVNAGMAIINPGSRGSGSGSGSKQSGAGSSVGSGAGSRTVSGPSRSGSGSGTKNAAPFPICKHKRVSVGRTNESRSEACAPSA